MKTNHGRLALLSGIALAAAAMAGSASAKGCNGVVNQLVWGCAAWDNNNGPQFPNYKGAATAAKPATPAASILRPANPALGVAQQNANGLLSPANTNPNGFVGHNGSAVVVHEPPH